MTPKYRDALDIVRAIVKHFDWSKRLYQGKVDVTEWMNFQEIAESCELTDQQYNRLIERAQGFVDAILAKEV